MNDLDLNVTPGRPITIQTLYDIVKSDDLSSSKIDDNIQEISGDLGLSSLTPALDTINAVINKILSRDFSDFNKRANDDLGKYVKGTHDPAVAFVVGDQHFNAGGDFFDSGVTASYLYSAHDGAPGVTSVVAAQYFHGSFFDTGHRSAERLGVAAIYQNTTLKVADGPKDPYADETIPLKKLGPPWQYKIGVEYTSPVYGLHETGSLFARYRWTPSYWEVTVSGGQDGLRKGYLDVSIGRSYTF